MTIKGYALGSTGRVWKRWLVCLQDALRFGIYGEDAMADLAETIENYGWVEPEAWLDVHRASLLQRREAEAPIPGVENKPSPPQREHPSGGRKMVRVPRMEELQRDTLTGSERTSMHPLVVLSLLLRIITII